MKNLFIDSNIWLSLYHFTNDDLEQFTKLKNYIGSSIRLFVPQQVRDEIYRNREAKITDALRSFEIKSIQYPAFCKGYEEYDLISKDYSSIMSRMKEWKDKINKDILAEKLPADLVINELLDIGETISCDKYVDSAFTRYRIGNPPGKENKYGDAINWECLLDVIPSGEDLHFISSDKDYKSKLNDEQFNPFLVKEWTEKKNSNLLFYGKLVAFLNEHVDEIKLETELDKEKYINELATSGNFYCTHRVISNLRKFSGWTEDQIEALCSIAESNSQVDRILYDPDVFSFYSGILAGINTDELPECSTKRIGESIELYSGLWIDQ